MIDEWKEFLTKAGAEFDDRGVVHYGNPRRELSVAITGNVFCDLSHFGLIAVHGEDAETFLQGQLTNDVTGVDAGHSQLSGLCNPKGRLLGSFRLFRNRDSYYLCMPVDMVEGVLTRLRMFVLRSKVTLEEASDTFVHLGVSGIDAEATLGEFAGSRPQAVNEVLTQDNQVIIQVPGIHPSYELFTTVDNAAALWDKLNVKCAPIGAEAWRLLDIQAGIPIIYPGTREAFVPQMTNLQLVDGVSFKKGCYTGQEIVARMQYLGKLKKRMYRGRVNTSSAPLPGDEVFAGDDTQSCGQLVAAAEHPDGDYAVLAVLQIQAAENGAAQLHLEPKSGPELVLETLPYPFPADPEQ